MPKKIVPQSSQLALFNPDLELVKFSLPDGSSIELLFDHKNRTFWVNQKQMSILFDIDESRISHHIKTLKDEWATYAQSAGVETRKFTVSQQEGARTIEREIEHYNHDTVFDVGYRARSNERTFWFRRVINEYTMRQIEAEHARAMQKEKHKRAGDVTQYQIAGFTQSHAEKRVDSKDTYKQMSAAIIRLAEPAFIGQVVSKEYILLYGKTTNELKAAPRNDKIRDALPEMHLEYLEWSEKTLARVLSLQDQMTTDELMSLAIKTITPIAEHMKMMCDLMGIDRATGAKLLEAGKK